jgi:hypothetical protein
MRRNRVTLLVVAAVLVVGAGVAGYLGAYRPYQHRQALHTQARRLGAPHGFRPAGEPAVEGGRLVVRWTMRCPGNACPSDPAVELIEYASRLGLPGVTANSANHCIIDPTACAPATARIDGYTVTLSFYKVIPDGSATDTEVRARLAIS